VERVVSAVCQTEAEIATLLKRSCEELVGVSNQELGKLQSELRYFPVGGIGSTLSYADRFEV